MQVITVLYERGDLIKVCPKDKIIKYCVYDRFKKIYKSLTTNYSRRNEDYPPIIEENNLEYCDKVGIIKNKTSLYQYSIEFDKNKSIILDEYFLAPILQSEESQSIYNFCKNNCINECDKSCPFYRFKIKIKEEIEINKNKEWPYLF